MAAGSVRAAVRWAGLGALVIGCGATGDAGAEDDFGSTTQQAIVAGADDDGDRAVVALVTASMHPFCTATLIAPRVLVTAADCTYFYGVPQVLLQASWSRARRSRPSAVRHPDIGTRFGDGDFGGGCSEHDCGEACLRRARCRRDAPHRRLRDDEVGGGEERRKRSGQVRVVQVNASDIETFPDSATACDGDSGGAAFAADGTLVGVVSAGDRGCTLHTILTRLDAHADFLGPRAAEGRGRRRHDDGR